MHSTGRDLGAGRARCAQGWRSGGAVRPRRMRHCRSGSAPYAERQAGHGPARPWSAAIEGPQEVTIGQGAVSELAHLKQGAWDAAVGVGRGRAPLRPQPRRDLPPRRRCGRNRQRRGDRRQRAPCAPSQTLTDPHGPPHRRARLGPVIASAAWITLYPTLCPGARTCSRRSATCGAGKAGSPAASTAPSCSTRCSASPRHAPAAASATASGPSAPRRSSHPCARGGQCAGRAHFTHSARRASGRSAPRRSSQPYAPTVETPAGVVRASRG